MRSPFLVPFPSLNCASDLPAMWPAAASIFLSRLSAKPAQRGQFAPKIVLPFTSMQCDRERPMTHTAGPADGP